MIFPELLPENMVGVPPGPVVAGTQWDRFAIGTANPETADSDMGSFHKTGSTNRAREATDEF